MEIERKFLIKELPDHLNDYPYHEIEQAYLCTQPVIRIRKRDNEYILTYKSEGLMAREEVELPLTEKAYLHLLAKADGRIIRKRRYLLPDQDGLTIELDLFQDDYEGQILAEVEFPDMETALAYSMPDWFAEDVTSNPRYHNSNMALVVHSNA